MMTNLVGCAIETFEDVVQWLHEIDMSPYVDNFRRHKIDGAVLVDLDDDMLVEIGIDTKLDRLKIMKGISKLRSENCNSENTKRNNGNLGGGAPVQWNSLKCAPLRRQRSMSDVNVASAASFMSKSQGMPVRIRQSDSPVMGENGSTRSMRLNRSHSSHHQNPPPLSVTRLSIDSNDSVGQPASNSPFPLFRRNSCGDLPVFNNHNGGSNIGPNSGNGGSSSAGQFPQLTKSRTPTVVDQNNRDLSSRSCSPDALMNSTDLGPWYRASPLAFKSSQHHGLNRSDSMCSGRSSVGFGSMSSSTCGDLLGFTRLKRFCAGARLECCLEVVQDIYLWPILDFLVKLLKSNPKLQENPANFQECEVMVRQCVENMEVNMYLTVSDLIDDLDMPDFRDDLRRYGCNKKRLLNELYSVLSEIRGYVALNSPEDRDRFEDSQQSMEQAQLSAAVMQGQQAAAITHRGRTTSTNGTRSTPRSSQQQHATTLRRRSASIGTAESVCSSVSSRSSVHQQIANGQIPPFSRQSSMDSLHGLQHRASSNSCASFREIEQKSAHSPTSDAQSCSTDYSSENESAESPMSFSYRNRKINDGGGSFNRQIPNYVNGMIVSTPPSRPVVYPQTDQPKGYRDRRERPSSLKLRSNNDREKLAAARNERFIHAAQGGEEGNDFHIRKSSSGSLRKHRHRFPTEPLPTANLVFKEEKKPSARLHSMKPRSESACSLTEVEIATGQEQQVNKSSSSMHKRTRSQRLDSDGKSKSPNHARRMSMIALPVATNVQGHIEVEDPSPTENNVNQGNAGGIIKHNNNKKNEKSSTAKLIRLQRQASAPNPPTGMMMVNNSNANIVSPHQEQEDQQQQQQQVAKAPKSNSAGKPLKYKRVSSKLSIDVPESKNGEQQQQQGGLKLQLEIPLSAGGKSGLPSALSTNCSKKKLAIDMDAIEHQLDIEKSYNFMEDGGLKYGQLVIGMDGLDGAPGLQALTRDADRDCAKLFRGPRPRFSANEEMVKMQFGLKILGPLGKGAGGTVHKAIHVPSLRIVAVKETLVNDKTQRKQMRRELESLLHGLHHPNVVQFYDSFYDPNHGTTSLVFEYMSYGSLQDLVDKHKPVDPNSLDSIAIDCLRGLEYLHKLNLLHRDIKPSNLLISATGNVKIADFGISRDLEGTEALANTYLGTFMYMSPERIAGDEYSYKADVWSLGLSLLTCALGKFPFKIASGYWGLSQAIREEPFPSLPENYSGSFSKMLLLCLKRKATDRVSTTALLQSDYFTNLSAKLQEGGGECTPLLAFFKQPTPRDKSAELDKVVSQITSYYRDLYTENLKSPGASAREPLSVALDVVKLRGLADQLNLQPHIVIGKVDQGLRKLDQELRDEVPSSS